MTISFWMKDEHIAGAKAIGALPVAEDIPHCALMVGDTVSFPAFRAVAYKVASRHYRSGTQAHEPQWIVELVPAEHPF